MNIKDKLSHMSDEEIASHLEDQYKRIAELEGAIERALDALDPYLNANSPYTPDVLAAAAFLREVTDGEKAEPKPLAVAKFKVGDRVRIRDRADDAMGLKLFYSNVPYDTIILINEQGVHQLEYGADGSLSSTPWMSDHLEHYSE